MNRHFYSDTTTTDNSGVGGAVTRDYTVPIGKIWLFRRGTVKHNDAGGARLIKAYVYTGTEFQFGLYYMSEATGQGGFFGHLVSGSNEAQGQASRVADPIILRYGDILRIITADLAADKTVRYNLTFEELPELDPAKCEIPP